MSDTEESVVAESVDSGTNMSPSILCGLEKLKCSRSSKEFRGVNIHRSPARSRLSSGMDSEDSQETQIDISRCDDSVLRRSSEVGSPEFPAPAQKLRKLAEVEAYTIKAATSKPAHASKMPSIHSPVIRKPASEQEGLQIKSKIDDQQKTHGVGNQNIIQCLDADCICKKSSVTMNKLTHVQTTIQQLLNVGEDYESTDGPRHLLNAMQHHLRQLSKLQHGHLQELKQVMKRPSESQPPELMLQLQKVMSEKQQMLHVLKIHRKLTSEFQIAYKESSGDTESSQSDNSSLKLLATRSTAPAKISQLQTPAKPSALQTPAKMSQPQTPAKTSQPQTPAKVSEVSEPPTPAETSQLQTGRRQIRALSNPVVFCASNQAVIRALSNPVVSCASNQAVFGNAALTIISPSSRNAFKSTNTSYVTSLMSNVSDLDRATHSEKISDVSVANALTPYDGDQHNLCSSVRKFIPPHTSVHTGYKLSSSDHQGNKITTAAVSKSKESCTLNPTHGEAKKHNSVLTITDINKAINEHLTQQRLCREQDQITNNKTPTVQKLKIQDTGKLKLLPTPIQANQQTQSKILSINGSQNSSAIEKQTFATPREYEPSNRVLNTFSGELGKLPLSTSSIPADATKWNFSDKISERQQKVQQIPQQQRKPATILQLIEAKLLHPGRDVLSLSWSGHNKVYRASLDSTGSITDRQRGCFSGPSQWTASVMDKSVATVSKLAWKSILFKGKSLAMFQQRYAEVQAQSSGQPSNLKNSTGFPASHVSKKTNQNQRNIWLVSNLRVQLLMTEELVPTTKQDWENVPACVYADLDKWE